MITIKLKETIKYEDKEYKELNFKFEDLCGKDIIDIETEILMTTNMPVLVNDIDSRFIAHAAAKAANVDIGIIENLKYCDFKEVKRAALNFLRLGE